MKTIEGLENIKDYTEYMKTIQELENIKDYTEYIKTIQWTKKYQRLHRIYENYTMDQKILKTTQNI